MTKFTAITKTHMPYYGGKWLLAPWIISHFPPHRTYVEVCGGSAAVLIQKEPSALEIYNDLDNRVVDVFRAIRDEPEELRRLLLLTPWSREEHNRCRERGDDWLDNARRLIASLWMSISNTPHDKKSGWRSATHADANFSLAVDNFRDAADLIPLVGERFRRVQIECRGADYIIDRYGKHPETLIYFDPPYVKETRSSKNQYELEMSDNDHIRLAALMHNINGYGIVSGYDNDLYRELYENKGWRRVSKEAQTNSASFREESLWLNRRAQEAGGNVSDLPLFANLKENQ